MRVYLFRHGPAGHGDPAQWPDDRKRPLTPRGIERTELAARGLERLIKDRSCQVLSSPLARAEQTARILHRELGCDEEMEPMDALAPGGSYRTVIRGLAARDANGAVCLVGHEPDLGVLAGWMVFGAPRALELKKAGAAALVFDGTPKAGTARLEWLLPPRLLRRMGRRRVAT
jgi:phosphohistidine phosphatase